MCIRDSFGTPQAPECQMCFHFPVMPRLYYSLRAEKAAPIIDVLNDTPAIPCLLYTSRCV